MAATYQSVATGSSTGGNYTITKPSGTVDGDLLFLVSYQDPDGSPTNQTASGFTQVGSTLDNATGSIKLWRKAASGEGASYTIGCDSAAAGVGIMIRVNGHNAASPIDGTAQTSTGAASTSHVAPSVTDVAGSDSLLITGAYGLCNGTAASYTGLSAGTERADLQPATGNWIVGSLGTEALAASGATGTRTWTCSISRAWNTFAVAIASASTAVSAPPSRRLNYGALIQL